MQVSDNVDDQEMNFAEGETESAPPPKAKGAGPGIARILTFVGIGLGAVLFIVTVVVITVGIVNKGGKAASQPILKSEEFQAATPLYQYVGTVGEIRTRTSDVEPAQVIVKIELGFDLEDKKSAVDVNQRLPQIRDWLRNYFTGKTAADLAPDRERILKDEIRENLNNILTEPTVKEVLFERLDVIKY
jgi:flagellar FliL protein